MTSSPGAFIALLLVSGGLAAVYARLRLDFDRSVSLLTLALLAAATPLYAMATRAPSRLEALVFACVAALVWAGAVGRSRLERLGASGLVLVLPVLAAAIGPRAAERQLLLTLFGPGDGLFSLTPVFYVAGLSLAATAARHPREATLGVVALIAWVLAGAPLTGAAALLAIGLASAIDWLRRRPLVAVAALALAALGWNHLLMVQYTVGVLPKDEPVSFARLVRQQAEVYTRPPFVYPFAFPANVVFAWRSGLPVDRFDDLAPITPAHQFDLRMDRSADRFLLDGWEAPGMDAERPVWWMGERRAEIAVPLATVSSALVVDLTARARLDDPALDVDLAIELNGHEIGRFVAPASAPTDVRLTLPATVVGRVLRAGYNRLAIVNHGTHRADPSDTRPPGPLADRRRGRGWPVAIYRVRLAPLS